MRFSGLLYASVSVQTDNKNSLREAFLKASIHLVLLRFNIPRFNTLYLPFVQVHKRKVIQIIAQLSQLL